MPPETPTTQLNTGGGQPQGLDPSVVALTKAIGKAESGGNYGVGDKTGDGANSAGAYQMTPGFLQEWAPKSGVQYQSGMKLTPAQQDEIAYNAVKTMGTTGDPAHPHLGKLTPAQISSAWNTGDPNAYLDPEYGKNNTYGSTQKYVDKVSEYYNQGNGTQSGNQSASNPIVPTANASYGGNQKSSGQPDWLSAIEGLGLGAAGWAAGVGGSYLKNAATDVAADAAIGAIGGSAVEPGGGTLLGGLGGAGVGLIQAGLQTAMGGVGGGDKQPPSSAAVSSAAASPNQPSLTQEGNQVAPNKETQDFGHSVLASQTVQNAINEALQGTASNRVFSQSQPGKDAINTASQFGLIEPDENGNLVFNSEKSKQAEGELGNLLDSQIKAQGGKASPGSVANYAGSYIGKDKFATDIDRQEAAKEVRKNLEATGVPMNGQMNLEDMREKQKQHYKEAQPSYGKTATTAHMLAHKALGDAYGRVIRDNLPNKELYDQTKKMQQNLINAKQVGKRLNGKKAPKNTAMWQSFLKGSARYAEIYIGDRLGGPLGAILGSMAGEHINRAIDRKYGKTIFETKGMKAAMDILKDTKPAMYSKLIGELQKNGVNVEAQEVKGKEGTIKGLIKRKPSSKGIALIDRELHGDKKPD